MIAGITLYEIAAWFMIYGFIGWVLEVIFHAVRQGVIVNRGFLNGPICPIYGFGMILIIMMEKTVTGGLTGWERIVAVFFGGMILTTTIELLGGWVLDKLFHTRWWDYSYQRFNLGGFICLQSSLAWGAGSLAATELVHPLVSRLTTGLIPSSIGVWLLLVLYTILGVDIGVTLAALKGLDKRLRAVKTMRDSLRRVSDSMTESIGGNALNATQSLEHQQVQMALAKAEFKDNAEETMRAISARRDMATKSLDARKDAAVAGLTAGRAAAASEFDRRKKALADYLKETRYIGAGRLVRAFPSMKSREYDEIITEMKKESDLE
ncbi:MAG: putative ABC transporter permease [Eubacteriaceae bacterium]|nr:putative ABC transporter permease [Eubacteriaceae bacterium]